MLRNPQGTLHQSEVLMKDGAMLQKRNFVAFIGFLQFTIIKRLAFSGTDINNELLNQLLEIMLYTVIL